MCERTERLLMLKYCHVFPSNSYSVLHVCAPNMSILCKYHTFPNPQGNAKQARNIHNLNSKNIWGREKVFHICGILPIS